MNVGGTIPGQGSGVEYEEESEPSTGMGISLLSDCRCNWMRRLPPYGITKME